MTQKGEEEIYGEKQISGADMLIPTSAVNQISSHFWHLLIIIVQLGGDSNIFIVYGGDGERER